MRLSLLSLPFDCSNKHAHNSMKDRHALVASNLLDFFEQNAYHSELKAFYSDTDNEGNRTSIRIYNIAPSLNIYGFADMSQFKHDYLKFAKNAATFQPKYLPVTMLLKLPAF